MFAMVFLAHIQQIHHHSENQDNYNYYTSQVWGDYNNYHLSINSDAVGLDACVDILNCRARVEGELLSIDAELGVSGTVMGSVETYMLDKATFGEPLEAHTGVWTVCYSQRDEDLWSVAKRYGVSSDDIKGDPAKDRFVMIER